MYTKLRTKNETRIVRTIGELLVPSADSAISLGHTKFMHLVVSINEAWDNSLSLDAVPHRSKPLEPPPRPAKFSRFQLPRPQPDYAVGYSLKAFTDAQLAKLAPFLGDIDMRFSFLTTEVNAKGLLDIGDRQNAHSITLAIRGVVELFRIVKREKELNQEILGFSISHDNCTVRIYGHYVIIDGEKTTYYRNTLQHFVFAGREGRDKWICYNFALSVYEKWAPSHFKRISSAVDMIPDVDSERSQPDDTDQPDALQQPEVSELSFSDTTGLSHGIGGVNIESSFTTAADPTSQSPTSNTSKSSVNKRQRILHS